MIESVTNYKTFLYDKEMPQSQTKPWHQEKEIGEYMQTKTHIKKQEYL